MSDWSVEPHGSGYAIYRGRDCEHHGFNLGRLTECDAETAALIERALNTFGAAPDTQILENQAWLLQGEQIMHRLERGEGGILAAVAFGIGQWWADRPWRKR